ncbi:HelD family protein [Phytoactinopolyspora mesophila]|uniref:AAA family ATPase n=1 Tax=Phytoactinopolyspora mesophila TaxID=2650750 RepID=A0A7K3M042_9ACTN|nr:AAA family ATPase [Phytoactinopolyspora mesophila]NDL56282.1 AAA family ATPase [Phytoactinopolyspora mesophila]
MLYDRLDLLRTRTTKRLAELYKQRGFNHQAVWEREAFVDREVERLERLLSVDRGLCFGRLDTRDHTVSHIGRIAIADDEYNPLLIDWRAPAAEPFYRATAANPGDLARRRHIQVRHRRVVGVDDEVFSPADSPAGSAAALHGEAALLASLSEHRTGRMSDIVATIQAEQDRIIRSPLGGVLVVQGGPGTGKTVAALHRAAYLLYTYRDRLERSGVLVLGPNRTFMRYIEQVLPSLGETGVTLTTVARMLPEVDPSRPESREAAVVKGDLRMAPVIAAAVRHHQRIPRTAIPLHVEGADLTLEPADVRAARARARRSRRPHNEARPVFTREILTVLARQYLERSGQVADDDDVADARADLRDEPDVRAVLEELWPVLSAPQLLAELFSSPKLLATTARALDPEERAALQHQRYASEEHPWTEADVPLLDEAAELLGEPPDEAALAQARREAEERRAEAEFARDLLTGLDLGFPVDAGQVAERYRGTKTTSSVGDRAAADRTWTYGHVIVDEAQELSPMAWRMVVRRVPSKSMTIVGDIAQTTAAAGARSWAAVLDPHVEGRWRQETLSVNYRTPAEVMDVAARVLSTIDAELEPPRSVRTTGVRPWALQVPSEKLVGETATVVSGEIDADEQGRLAVIAPAELAADIYAALTETLGSAPVAGVSGAAAESGDPAPKVALGTDDPAALDARAVVLTVQQAKGLEFDSVVIVEPASIVADSARGPTDLYVALTRPTQRLGLIHTGALPESLDGVGAPGFQPRHR